MPSSSAAARSLPMLPARVARPVSTLVIHCSATPSGAPLDRRVPADDPARVIDRWHGERGFLRRTAYAQLFNPHLRHIGYHFVIDLDGAVWSGRSLEETGAHVAGRNIGSLGVCLVGGAERDGAYTSAQWAALAELCTALRALMPGIGAVVGHRDLSIDADGNGEISPREWLKTCPGFSVADWLAAGMAPLPGHVLTEPQPTQGDSHA